MRRSSLAPSLLNLRAFSVLDATVAIYETDENDVPVGDPVKLLADSLAVEPRVQNIPVLEHGRAFSGERCVDVSWSVVMQRPRTITLTGASTARVQWEPQRNVRYALVVVWHDVVRAVWEKQVFLGVTGAHASLDGANILSAIPLRAERRLTPTAGKATTPDFSISHQGDLRYVAADGTRTVLYTISDGQFTVVDSGLLATRATVTVDGSEMTVHFGSDAHVLTATATELNVTEIVSMGATFGETLPRVEFYSGNTRVASLDATGALHVASLTESATEPDEATGELDIRTTDDEWLFTLTASGLACVEGVEA